MTNEEVLLRIQQLDVHPNGLCKTLKHKHEELFNAIMELTSFLPEGSPFISRLYCLQNNITQCPICENPSCGNVVKWRTHGFAHHCSHKCKGSDPKVQKRRRHTNMRLYGVESACQSTLVKEKAKQTCIKRFGVDSYSKTGEFLERFKSTCMSRFGVNHPLKSDEIKDKVRRTNLDRLGVDVPSKSSVVKEKTKQTNNIRYGVDFGLGSSEIRKKIIQTNLNRHGVEHYVETDQFKQKSRDTCIQRYGCEFYQQSIDYQHNKKHRFTSLKYPDVEFDSTWEVKVYEFCRDNNIEVEYQPSMTFEYEYDGVIHCYHPDFLINGKLYEVKGDHFFNESGQMVNPYDHSQDGLYEAKHQCMLQNGAIILRENDILNLSFSTFKVHS